MEKNAPPSYPPRLAQDLVLDELFDLELYRAFRAFSSPGLHGLLDKLIEVEKGHHKFWEDFFDIRNLPLNLGRRVKLRLLAFLCRLGGDNAIHLILEAIEVYGIRKYLNLWRSHHGAPLGEAVRHVLRDEMEHEDNIVSSISERKINPDRIRNIFLGFNDGLVEILGAVSGFFAAFEGAGAVLAAGASVAVAGALSMAAGAFASIGSEDEIRRLEVDKNSFLGLPPAPSAVSDTPTRAALVVGISYFAGSLVPLLPVFFGAKNVLASFLAAGVIATVISTVLAFLSGMNVKRRIGLNLAIIAVAAGVTYAVGMLVKQWLGVVV